MRTSKVGGSLALEARGAAGVFLAEALILPTGLMTAAYLTRGLGPAGYGLFTVAASLTASVAWTTSSLFARTTVKFVSEAEDWRSVCAELVRLNLTAGLVATVVFLFAARPLATLFGDRELAGYLGLFAIDLLIFVAAQTHRNILVGMGRFSERALVAAARSIARLALIVLLVGMWRSVTAAILGSIGASIVELAVCRWFVQPGLSLRGGRSIPELWVYAGPLFLFVLCMRLFDRLDLFALKALGGTAADAGLYGAAQNLSVTPNLVALALCPLLLSSLGRHARRGELATVRRIARDAVRLVLGSLPFAAMAAASAEEVVTFLFGATFAAAGPVLALLTFAAVAMLGVSVGTTILTAAGRPGLTLATGAPMLAIALLGHLALIPRFGAIAAAWVTTVVAICGALTATVAAGRAWGFQLPLGTGIRSLALCAFAYGSAASWPAPGLWVVWKLAVIALVIPFGFWALGEFGAEERDALRSLVRLYAPMA